MILSQPGEADTEKPRAKRGFFCTGEIVRLCALFREDGISRIFCLVIVNAILRALGAFHGRVIHTLERSFRYARRVTAG